jgi:hypothetical protein
MSQRRPRFEERLTYEATPEETRILGNVVESLLHYRRVMASIAGAEAQALAIAAGIARDQMGRSGSSSEYAFPYRAIAAEIGAALHEPSGSIERRMADAEVLTKRLPTVREALTEGRITRKHAEIIQEYAGFVDEQALPEYTALTIAFAEDATQHQLRIFAKQLAERLGVLTREARQRVARRQHGVWARDLPDGNGELVIRHSAEVIRAIKDRADAQAKAFAKKIRRQNHAERVRAEADGVPPLLDERNRDQIRADILADELLTAAPTVHVVEREGTPNLLAEIRGTIAITIPVTTLAGLDDEPAFLHGYGPLDPDIARRFAKQAPGWERVFQNPDTAALLTVDHYEPTAAIRRLIDVRDEVCRFPSCDQPAQHCEKDHTVEYARGGPTRASNLAALCRPHHMLRHQTAWHPRQVSPGVIEWTSPAGRRYREVPLPQRRKRVLDQKPPF